MGAKYLQLVFCFCLKWHFDTKSWFANFVFIHILNSSGFLTWWIFNFICFTISDMNLTLGKNEPFTCSKRSYVDMDIFDEGKKEFWLKVLFKAYTQSAK